MIANAVFVATLIFLALGFWLSAELRFLTPWRSFILHHDLQSIALYCALLFANILGVTIPNILDAIARSNLIDSPGLIEANHQLVLSLVSGQARTPQEISDIVIKPPPAGAPIRIGDIAAVTPSVMPVYTTVTANGKPAVLLNIYRQPD